jgi:hypothetical protein
MSGSGYGDGYGYGMWMWIWLVFRLQEAHREHRSTVVGLF